MTQTEIIITIGLLSLATIITRFSPFLIFSGKREATPYIRYLGQILPPAIFGMLVVYSLRDTTILSGSRGLPELFAILVTAGLHLRKRKMLLSIAGGTIAYMLLVQFVF